jgi:hypothetical protein
VAGRARSTPGFGSRRGRPGTRGAGTSSGDARIRAVRRPLVGHLGHNIDIRDLGDGARVAVARIQPCAGGTTGCPGGVLAIRPVGRGADAAARGSRLGGAPGTGT